MQNGSNKAAIIVMAKAPRPGEVKTRLMPLLSPGEAASLASSFVQDVVICLHGFPAQVFLAYAPAGGRVVLEALIPRPDICWIEQRGLDLGARMYHALCDAADWGHSPLILVGTDSPHLPHEYIEMALEALTGNQADIVLGPTDDGGYYLVGMHSPDPGIFRDVAWSTSRACEDTAANALRLKMRLLRLPEWYDIDTPADLLRLCNTLRADPKLRERLPNTSHWIDSHDTIIRHEKPS